jgi:hypothetical protein
MHRDFEVKASSTHLRKSEGYREQELSQRVDRQQMMKEFCFYME